MDDVITLGRLPDCNRANRGVPDEHPACVHVGVIGVPDKVRTAIVQGIRPLRSVNRSDRILKLEWHSFVKTRLPCARISRECRIRG